MPSHQYISKTTPSEAGQQTHHDPATPAAVAVGFAMLRTQHHTESNSALCSARDTAAETAIGAIKLAGGASRIIHRPICGEIHSWHMPLKYPSSYHPPSAAALVDNINSCNRVA
jgi:hypothetical protein